MKSIRILATSLVLALGAGSLAAVAQQTVEGNAGGMQLQQEVVNELKRFGVDYPEGSYMTLEQINKLQALMQMNPGDEVAIRSGAQEILGM